MDNAHIIVVDDSEMTIYKLKAILMRLGYKVTTFTNPLQALEWLKTPGNTPNLIFSDLSMPEMDGTEFVRSIRRLPNYQKTPIIMLTSQVDIEDKITGIQAGADDYLSKTVTATELDLRVKALLQRSESSDPVFSQSVAKTISIFSLRGGVGTTSIAVNLSVALAQITSLDVCLWDLALSGGHCASFMNLNPKNTLIDLNEWADSSVDEKVLSQMILSHSSGVKLMPAPLSVAEAELVTPHVADLVWPFVQGNFTYLVVDAGNHFSEIVLNILERSDAILLVLSPEISALKSARDTLNIFEQLGYDMGKILLVINNTFPKFRLPAQSILPSLKNLPSLEIPYDSERMIKSISVGEPVVISAAKSEIGQAFFALASRLNVAQPDPKKKSSTVMNAFNRFLGSD